jgi:hypothetical protein
MKEHPMEQNTRHPMLDHLEAFVGEWESETVHRLLPDTVVRGRASFEWLEGGYFMIQRSQMEHPDFPDGIFILGCEEPDGSGEAGGGCTLRSYDSRGISRLMQLKVEPGVWTFWRDWPGFSQRFTGTLSADGNTITGVAELSEDGTTWEEDLRVTYTRVR